MDSLRRLQQAFKRFPGIGERQAMRFAYFLATANEGYVRELTEALTQLRKGIKRCARCYALSEQIENGLCKECRDPSADRSLLLVVEKDADRERFIQSHTYHGTYFLLGGLAPAIEKDTASHIRMEELARLVQTESGSLKEIILALSSTPDGARTEALVLRRLEQMAAEKFIALSILGKGLSTGTEIEYSDAATLGNALESRTHTK